MLRKYDTHNYKINENTQDLEKVQDIFTLITLKRQNHKDADRLMENFLDKPEQLKRIIKYGNNLEKVVKEFYTYDDKLKTILLSDVKAFILSDYYAFNNFNILNFFPSYADTLEKWIKKEAQIKEEKTIFRLLSIIGHCLNLNIRYKLFEVFLKNNKTFFSKTLHTKISKMFPAYTSEIIMPFLDNKEAFKEFYKYGLPSYEVLKQIKEVNNFGLLYTKFLNRLLETSKNYETLKHLSRTSNSFIKLGQTDHGRDRLAYEYHFGSNSFYEVREARMGLNNKLQSGYGRKKLSLQVFLNKIPELKGFFYVYGSHEKPPVIKIMLLLPQYSLQLIQCLFTSLKKNKINIDRYKSLLKEVPPIYKNAMIQPVIDDPKQMKRFYFSRRELCSIIQYLSYPSRELLVKRILDSKEDFKRLFPPFQNAGYTLASWMNEYPKYRHSLLQPILTWSKKSGFSRISKVEKIFHKNKQGDIIKIENRPIININLESKPRIVADSLAYISIHSLILLIKQFPLIAIDQIVVKNKLLKNKKVFDSLVKDSNSLINLGQALQPDQRHHIMRLFHEHSEEFQRLFKFDRDKKIENFTKAAELFLPIDKKDCLIKFFSENISTKDVKSYHQIERLSRLSKKMNDPVDHLLASIFRNEKEFERIIKRFLTAQPYNRKHFITCFPHLESILDRPKIEKLISECKNLLQNQSGAETIIKNAIKAREESLSKMLRKVLILRENSESSGNQDNVITYDKKINAIKAKINDLKNNNKNTIVYIRRFVARIKNLLPAAEVFYSKEYQKYLVGESPQLQESFKEKRKELNHLCQELSKLLETLQIMLTQETRKVLLQRGGNLIQRGLEGKIEIGKNILSFDEYELKDDRDYGFVALRTSRRQVQKLLMNKKVDYKVRQSLSKDIMKEFSQIIGDNQLKGVLANDIFNILQEKYDYLLEQENQIQETKRQVRELLRKSGKKEINKDELSLKDLLGFLPILKKKNRALCAKFKLEYESYRKAYQAFQSQCSSETVLTQYITKGLGGNLFLGLEIALLVASMQGMSLYIWRKNEKEGALYIYRKHVSKSEDSDSQDNTAVHLMHTPRFPHFNGLVVSKQMSFEKVSEHKKPIAKMAKKKEQEFKQDTDLEEENLPSPELVNNPVKALDLAHQKHPYQRVEPTDETVKERLELFENCEEPRDDQEYDSDCLLM